MTTLNRHSNTFKNDTSHDILLVFKAPEIPDLEIPAGEEKSSDCGGTSIVKIQLQGQAYTGSAAIEKLHAYYRIKQKSEDQLFVENLKGHEIGKFFKNQS